MLDVQRMAFRQHNKNPDTTWRRTSRAELLATGLPDFLVDDERRWTYVLLHGDDLESGWSPSWITKDQAADLLRLLHSHYENRVGLELFTTLEKRIDDKLHVS
jgi:hypothetical protein